MNIWRQRGKELRIPGSLQQLSVFFDFTLDIVTHYASTCFAAILSIAGCLVQYFGRHERKTYDLKMRMSKESTPKVQLRKTCTYFMVPFGHKGPGIASLSMLNMTVNFPLSCSHPVYRCALEILLQLRGPRLPEFPSILKNHLQ